MIVNIEDIISSFKKTNEDFSKSINLIWPTVGSRGFTESNLVQSFLFYCKSMFNAITYSEVPFGGKSRVDGIAFIDFTNTAPMLIIEAKRIKENQYNNAYDEIKKDTNRMLENARIIDILERINKKEICSVSVQPLFIADVWIGNKKRSEDVKAIWESKENQNSLFPGWRTAFSDVLWHSEYSKAKYHQMLAIGNINMFHRNSLNKWELKEQSIS